MWAGVLLLNVPTFLRAFGIETTLLVLSIFVAAGLALAVAGGVLYRRARHRPEHGP
jgi:hypothetical protein